MRLRTPNSCQKHFDFNKSMPSGVRIRMYIPIQHSFHSHLISNSRPLCHIRLDLTHACQALLYSRGDLERPVIRGPCERYPLLSLGRQGLPHGACFLHGPLSFYANFLWHLFSWDGLAAPVVNGSPNLGGSLGVRRSLLR